MPSERKPRKMIPPETIYLQVVGSDDTADVEETYSRPFDDSEVTWCADKINDSDLEYRLVKRRTR